MTERPILFSGPMVRAILDGRKTQTRRVFIPPPPFDWTDDISVELAAGSITPRHAVGDRLWVRETWGTWGSFDHMRPSQLTGREGIAYAADQPGDPAEHICGRVRPSIHMPKWAARIWLEVTGVRVERVQDISEADAVAEGVQCSSEDILYPNELAAFRPLWDSLNAKRGYGWDANPWVAVIEFRRIDHDCRRD